MIARSALPSALCAALALLLSSAALADPWLPEPGDRYHELRAGVFSADSYHDKDGGRSPLWSGGINSQRTFTSYNEFGWKKHVSFLLELPAVSVTRHTNASNGFNATETGFGDLHVGVRRKLVSNSALEVQWIAPMGYNRSLDPHLGDGYQSFSGTVDLGAALGTHGFVELAGGYRDYLDKHGPTDQALASATVGLWLGSKLLVEGKYRGAMSVSNAEGFTALPTDAVPGTADAHITTHMAGPALVYRVDDHIDLIGGSMHTASAKNALHVDQFYVGLAVKQTRLNRLQGMLGGTRKP